MEPFVIFKYLHIASMFYAVALAVSGELVVRRVADTLDARAIATTVDRIQALGIVSTGLFLAGAVFGVIAALTGQINPFAPWLLLSYALFVTAVVIGVGITDPWAVRLGAAAKASPADGPSEELRLVVGDARARFATVALIALTVTIIFLMVVKPIR